MRGASRRLHRSKRASSGRHDKVTARTRLMLLPAVRQRWSRFHLVTLSPCLLLLIASGSHADDWPRFLGPLGTSVSSEKGIIAPWPKDGLRIVWHRKLGTGYGAPSIASGKLLVFDRAVEKVELGGKAGYRETKRARL